jgi:hypothetical protein
LLLIFTKFKVGVNSKKAHNFINYE